MPEPREQYLNRLHYRMACVRGWKDLHQDGWGWYGTLPGAVKPVPVPRWPWDWSDAGELVDEMRDAGFRVSLIPSEDGVYAVVTDNVVDFPWESVLEVHGRQYLGKDYQEATCLAWCDCNDVDTSDLRSDPVSDAHGVPELLPCPFCGAEPVRNTSYDEYFVHCINLNCSVNPCTKGYNFRLTADDVWNTRYPLVGEGVVHRVADLKKES